VFGASYASTKWELVANRDGALERGAFEYRGRPVEMPTHLKIGWKDSMTDRSGCISNGLARSAREETRMGYPVSRAEVRDNGD
jgi:hypothetical protein